MIKDKTPDPYGNKQIKASVIIPVKNGGILLVDVLKMVLAQQTPWPFEILVIDSGSRDGSQDRVQGLNVSLHTIAPETFGHGKTRNLGVELSRGEFIAFLTQDALPADQHWLFKLISAAELTSDIAGAFGRHLPYSECSPVMARELALHFSGFGEQPSLVRIDDVDRYRKDAGYRQFLHFFSNNNACIRRSIWEKIPFPDTDFAEDQLWAKSVIEAGYAKAYAPDACVYHSHNFGVSESYQRAFDESSALKRLFGYDLVPSIAYLLVQWGRLVWRDWKWIGEDNSSIETKSRWFFKMPFLTLARLAGFYMGGNQDRLPNWLIEHFSRDKTLQRS